MTDQEIIKGLECLRGDLTFCDKCPYQFIGFSRCHRAAAKDGIDLIARKQAEIEMLKRLLEHEERLTNLIAKKRYKDDIKEFAEKIKRHCTSIELNEYINSLVEEMAGGSK